MTFLTHPAFRFCSYCGVEGKLVEHNDKWNFVACSFCFAAATGGVVAGAMSASADWINNEWSRDGKQSFLKRVYAETDDEAVKIKIMAMILAQKE